MQPLDSSIANASDVATSRVDAGSGLTFMSPDPVLLPKGSVICRVGHAKVKKAPVPEADNYMSPWWISQADFRAILAKGQRDPTWAARVTLAIADQWGGDCTLQVQAELTESLYAWSGPGRAISGGRNAVAVPVTSPRAYWVPDASVQQFFIPGLKSMPRGRAGALWATSLKNRSVSPLLLAGQANINLCSGKPFLDRSALPHGRR